MSHTLSSQGWSVQRLSAALGAEISGIDLRTNQSSTIDGIRRLLLDHQVLFFPDQHLSVEEHVRLGEQFGALEGHPNLSDSPNDHPKIFRLTEIGRAS